MSPELERAVGRTVARAITVRAILSGIFADMDRHRGEARARDALRDAWGEVIARCLDAHDQGG